MEIGREKKKREGKVAFSLACRERATAKPPDVAGAGQRSRRRRSGVGAEVTARAAGGESSKRRGCSPAGRRDGGRRMGRHCKTGEGSGGRERGAEVAPSVRGRFTSITSDPVPRGGFAWKAPRNARAHHGGKVATSKCVCSCVCV